ncbi:tyrosine-type recombinase/integrase [Kitasatospora sp. NPDC052896]|uniref:tyrosine-type recombinase/integrase n=1 Tax=Kitasatospora sp. NPDC052896 TaxID=3364061 RepID=UPI0037C77B68
MSDTTTSFDPAQYSYGRPVVDTLGRDLRTPDDLRIAFLKRYNSEDSKSDYDLAVRQFFLFMRVFQPDTPVFSTTPGHVEAFRDFLSSPHPDGHPECNPRCARSFPNTTRSSDVKISRLSSYFRYCIGQKKMKENPVVSTPGSRDREPQGAKEILLPAQIEEMLAAARKESDRSLVIVAVLVGMGLRISELHLARIEHIRRYKAGWTLDVHRKGAKIENGAKIDTDMQTLDIPHALVPILEPYLEGVTEGPLIPAGRFDRARSTRSPKMLSVRAIFDTVVRLGAIVAAHLKFHPHLLRHTAITLALTDPAAKSERVAAYFGHANTATLRKYDHHPRLPDAGHHKNPVGLDWATQKGTTTSPALAS